MHLAVQEARIPLPQLDDDTGTQIGNVGNPLTARARIRNVTRTK